MKRILASAWLIAAKDLRVEARSRELIYTTLFFAITCILVFAFAFVRPQTGLAIEGTAPGVLWVAIAFSGTLALGRTFERERQSETLRALLASPVERAAVYLGKLIGMLILLFAAEIILVPLVGLLFHADFAAVSGMFLGLLVSGTIGFAGVGTLFAAMLVRAQSRDVLLPIILYPIVVPVLLGGMQGTSALLAPEPDLALARTWLSMLVFFDATFITLALWTFAPVMSD